MSNAFGPSDDLLEEGLADVDNSTEMTVPVGDDEKKNKHSLRHPNLHRRRQKKKEKLESKLPTVMQGAEDVEDAARRLMIKNEIVAGVGEFCGTFLFLLLSLGIASVAGQQNLGGSTAGGTGSGTSLDASQLMFSSLGFGLSLAVNAWIFFRVSGGLFNPAVTLALFLTKSLTWYRTIILFVVQFVAAIAASAVGTALIPGGLNARTKLTGTTTIAQGFFIEVFMTAQLIFSVFMLAGEKHRGTFMAPIGIGLALFISEMFATGFTGGSLNPDVVAGKFDGTAWIYYTAPFVGALLSTAIYMLLKVAQYETAVEGQDGDDTHLVMRNKDGEVTGMVDEVRGNEAEQVLADSSNKETNENERAPMHP